MSRTIKNLEDVQNYLQRQLNQLRFELSLWEKVELLKKKDGSNFQFISKSFKNATYQCNFSNLLDYPTINVEGFNEFNKIYESYSLYCYQYVNEMSEDDGRKTQGIKSNSCSRSIYIFDADEIMNLIVTHIANTKTLIRRFEEQLDFSEAIYSKFIGKVKDVINDMKNDCKDFRVDGCASCIEYLMIDALNNINYTVL